MTFMYKVWCLACRKYSMVIFRIFSQKVTSCFSTNLLSGETEAARVLITRHNSFLPDTNILFLFKAKYFLKIK